MQPTASQWLKQLDETWWDPEPGDTVIGVLTNIGTADGNYGSHTVLTLATEQGDVLIRVQHTALRSQYEKKQPHTGEQIAIRYKGESTGRSGNTYKDYALAVNRDRAVQRVDVEPPHDPEAEPELPDDPQDSATADPYTY